MKLNFSVNYKDVLAFLMKRINLVLWIFLGLVLLAEGFVIKDSISKVLLIADQSQIAGAQLVRVDFNLYDSIEKRLNENSQYLPSSLDSPDPFGLPSK